MSARHCTTHRHMLYAAQPALNACTRTCIRLAAVHRRLCRWVLLLAEALRICTSSACCMLPRLCFAWRGSTAAYCRSCCADALNNAITCTILAAAGPQRSRMLSQLYKDERSAKLPVFPFLEKVYLERILRK